MLLEIKTPSVGITKSCGYTHEEAFHTQIWTGSDLPIGCQCKNSELMGSYSHQSTDCMSWCHSRFQHDVCSGESVQLPSTCICWSWQFRRSCSWLLLSCYKIMIITLNDKKSFSRSCGDGSPWIQSQAGLQHCDTHNKNFLPSPPSIFTSQ